ncbi:MAG: DUF6502 family protein [Pseudomonadota bacterium]
MSEGELQKRLLKAMRRALRPLVRIMLRNGITAQTFQELARKEFVDVAHEEFTLHGRKQTAARVSVITGLSRKEVSRLQAIPPLDDQDLSFRNRASTVLSSWVVDPDFNDSKGDPLDLPFDGPSPNFSDLVKRYSGDMQPRAIADELMRNGALEVIDHRYRMVRRGYVPLDDPSAMIDMLGTDTAELIETIDYNIQSGDDKRLQAKVLAQNVPAVHLPEFDAFSKRLARHVLDELTHWLRARDEGDDFSGEDPRYEVGLGLYHITRLARGQGDPPEESRSTQQEKGT